jgi:hypothetical protein
MTLALVIGAILVVGCSGSQRGADVDQAADTPDLAGDPATEPTQTPGFTPADASPAGPTMTDSVVTGLVTDQGSGTSSLGLAGAGTLTSARRARLLALSDDGSLQVIAEGPLDPAGGYSLTAPLNVPWVISQVLDEAGQVLGAAVVGSSGDVAGGTVVAAPITTETSLEAEVLAGAAGCHLGIPGGLALVALNAVALVDADLAASVAAAVKAGANGDLIVNGLIRAVLAAARAQGDVLLDASVRLDVGALVQAAAALLANLNVQLNAVLSGNVSLEAVTTALFEDLRAALGVAGVATVNVLVRAHVAALASFCATLAASLAATVQVDAIVFAATHVAAQIEAHLLASVVPIVLQLAGAATEIVESAVQAGLALVAEIAGATSCEALKMAREHFLTALLGRTADAIIGLLGALLGEVTATLQAALGSVLDLVARLTAELEARLKASLGVTAGLDACVDVGAALEVRTETVAQVLDKFLSDAQAAAPGLLNESPPDVAKALGSALGIGQLLLVGIVP